jgi:predicted DCC family thiol-disulfide oxidoreductase YuxK
MMGMPVAIAKTSPSLLQVFYDGACPICVREIQHYRRRDREHRIEWIDIARPEFNAAAAGLDPQRLQQAMHARGADGEIHVGVEAFVQIWRTLPWAIGTGSLRALFKVPGMMASARVFYRLFARNRHRLTGRCTPERCGIES